MQTRHTLTWNRGPAWLPSRTCGPRLTRISTPLVVKLRQAAVTNSGLTSLLGSAPFRWYNTQLYEGSAYPAITANQISSVPVYSVGGRKPLARARVQFT